MFIADGSKVGGAFTRRSLFLSFVLHGVILLLAYDLLIKQKDDDKQKVKDDDIIVKVLPPDELVASVPEPPSPNNVQLPEKEPIESIGGEKNNPMAKTNAVARVKRRKPKSKHPIVKDHPIKSSKPPQQKVVHTRRPITRGPIINPPKSSQKHVVNPENTSLTPTITATDIATILNPTPIKNTGIKDGGTSMSPPSTSVSDSETQRCIGLIQRMIYSHWNGFSYSAALKPVHLTVRFGARGKIEGFYINKGSGDRSVDESALKAVKEIGGIPDLSEGFINQYPELEIVMKAIPQS